MLKVMSGQLRQALKLVLALLRNNADALALDIPPDKLLPHGSSLHRMSGPAMRACLAWCMSLVAEVRLYGVGCGWHHHGWAASCVLRL